jgi:hypothetical protein
MTVPRHLEQAALRLQQASKRITLAREKPPTLESLREWLAALTDLALALADMQSFNNESIHEKLQVLSAQAQRDHP